MTDNPVNPYASPQHVGSRNPPTTNQQIRFEDPVLTSSRREALLAFTIWLVACVYSISVCYRYGYGRDPATLTYVLGFPDWIFWGVVTPWTVCTLLCFIMAYFVIADSDLGEVQAEEKLESGVSETEHA